MNTTVGISAERSLQEAVLSKLKNDPKIQDVFGSQPRILNELGGSKPAYPYLVVGRHDVRNADATGVSIQDHIIDLQIMTRWRGRSGARDAVSLVQSILDNASLDLQTHRLVWCYLAFSDSLMLRDMQTFKGVIRIKARTTPMESGAN